MTWTIYGLLDGDGFLRYVGLTRVTIAERLSIHISESQSGVQTAKCAWIRSMLAVARRPVIVALELVESEDDADDAEGWWMGYARYIGCEILNARGSGGGSKAGRPVSTGRGRNSRGKHTIRLSPAELAEIVAAAQRDGASSVAAWMRDRALDEARLLE